MTKIKFALQTFSTFFKLFHTTLFLIFTMEFFRRLQIYLYYANPKEILRTNALLVVFLSGGALCATIVSTAMVCLFTKFRSFAVSVAEILCIAVFGLAYTYALLCMDASNTLLGYLWATGVMPLSVWVLIVFYYIQNTQRMRRWMWNVIHKLWAPFSCVALCALLWMSAITANMFIDKSEALGSADLKTVFDVSTNRPNVILVTLDGLTTKDMSLYGYERNTTPLMEKFARECFVFDHMYANYTCTTPSVVSLFTSKYPWHHKVYRPGQYSQEDRDETLFSNLRGYEIYVIAGAHYANPILIGMSGPKINVVSTISNSRFLRKIDYFLYTVCNNVIPVNELPLLSIMYPPRERDELFLMGNVQGSTESIISAKATFSMALDALKNVKEKPFFIWIHSLPPNLCDGYEIPEPFLYAFTDKGETIDVHALDYGPYDIKKDQKYIDAVKGRYNESIMYVDYCMWHFLTELKKGGLYDNSLIIISADHGEAYERGWYGHHVPCLLNCMNNIPLLVHLPGQTKGMRIHAMAEIIDLAPTILDVVGMPIPGWMEGESLLPYMEGDLRPSGKAKFSYHFKHRSFFNDEHIIAVMYDDHKLIYDISAGRKELYLLDDKDEKNDLRSQKPDIVNKLTSQIPSLQ